LIDLFGFYTIEIIGNIAEKIEEKGMKLRSYDKIINFAYYNSKSGHLFVSLVNLNHLIMISTTAKEVVWTLPNMGHERPLCAYSDQDKLIVCYDSNKVVVFDLLNRRLHDWSKRNNDKFPKNYLSRFNRIVGITALS